MGLRIPVLTRHVNYVTAWQEQRTTPTWVVAMNKEEFMASQTKVVAAVERMHRAQAALASGNRWGDTRRFQGRAAGSRLDKLDAARTAWSKAYSKAEADFEKQRPLNS